MNHVPYVIALYILNFFSLNHINSLDDLETLR